MSPLSGQVSVWSHGDLCQGFCPETLDRRRVSVRRGSLSEGSDSVRRDPMYGGKAGGTYPTGMFSCYILIYLFFVSQSCFRLMNWPSEKCLSAFQVDRQL